MLVIAYIIFVAMFVDTEKLIVEVEQRPCLWNLSEKSYSNKFLKEKAWQEVAESCFEDWDNLSNDDKNNNLTFLQKKWKSTRDYYSREKKKENEGRSGSAAKKRKTCPYFELLQFLNVTKQSRNSSSNIVSLEDTDNDSNLTVHNNNEDSDVTVNDNNNEQIETTPNEALSQPISMPQSSMRTPGYQNQPSADRSQTISSQRSAIRNKKEMMTPFQTSLLENLNKSNDDPNRHFLLSFLPEMSKMTERQNFEFRMEIMKALNKVKYQIAEQTTQSNWSHLASPFSDSQSSNQYFPSPVNRGYTTQEYNETNQFTSDSNV